MSLWKSEREHSTGGKDLSKIADVKNMLFDVLKDNIPLGFGNAVDYFQDEHNKLLIKQQLEQSISSVIRVVESEYDQIVYERVKESINQFMLDIIEFIDSKDAPTLDTIQSNFIKKNFPNCQVKCNKVVPLIK